MTRLFDVLAEYLVCLLESGSLKINSVDLDNNVADSKLSGLIDNATLLDLSDLKAALDLFTDGSNVMPVDRGQRRGRSCRGRSRVKICGTIVIKMVAFRLLLLGVV